MQNGKRDVLFAIKIGSDACANRLRMRYTGAVIGKPIGSV